MDEQRRTENREGPNEARQGESGQTERALMLIAVGALFAIFGGLLFYYFA